VDPRTTADEVRRDIQSRRFESVADVAVCHTGKLLGLIRIEDCLQPGRYPCRRLDGQGSACSTPRRGPRSGGLEGLFATAKAAWR
jgi:hypothetical protein